MVFFWKLLIYSEATQATDILILVEKVGIMPGKSKYPILPVRMLIQTQNYYLC